MVIKETDLTFGRARTAALSIGRVIVRSHPRLGLGFASAAVKAGFVLSVNNVITAAPGGIIDPDVSPIFWPSATFISCVTPISVALSVAPVQRNS